MRAQNPEISQLASRAGIVFPGALDYLPRFETKRPDGGVSFGGIDPSRLQIAMDEMAMDAPTYNQPGTVTTPNAGIPAFLTTYLDPKLIEVLLTPLKSEEIYGSTKKGDRTMQTAMFIMVESTGETSAYGDFNENGRSGVNTQYPQRQAFDWQTMTEWGDLEMEMAAAGRVDLASRLNISSANTLNRFANLVNFYGVNGLQNYGGLNDPNLAPALTPATKVAGGTGWKLALPTEILADFQAAFAQLQVQTGSNLELNTPMTVGLHSISELYLANTNSFGLTALEMVKKVFPNIRFVNAVQYLSGTTYSMQMIVDSTEGQVTCESAFSEKMRAHRIVPATSSFRQKKSAGGWGTIFYRPMCVVSMAGI